MTHLREPSVSVEERFWSHVDASGDCWEWNGRSDEYGRFGLNGKVLLAHRFVWELLVGPIPDGMTIDHLCRNRYCVNPGHLEVVSGTENIRRGYSASPPRSSSRPSTQGSL